MIKLTRDGNVTVGLSFLDHFENLFRAGDKPLRGALDVDGVVLVLVDCQVDLGRVQKIPDLVKVDLKVGNFDVELEVFLHGVDVVEDIVDDARDDALEV